MNAIKYVLNIFLIGFIFLILRSPLMMFLIGISLGTLIYHYYPSKVQGVFLSIEESIQEIKSDIYSTQVSDLKPEKTYSQ